MEKENTNMRFPHPSLSAHAPLTLATLASCSREPRFELSPLCAAIMLSLCVLLLGSGPLQAALDAPGKQRRIAETHTEDTSCPNILPTHKPSP